MASTGPCRPWLSRKATGSVQVSAELPTSANLDSKLAVRALMWSANNGTPRSSCICLLLTYQGAPVARRRHLDCNTCRPGHGCGRRIYMRGTHNPSWGGWAAYIAGLCSWRRDQSYYSGGDPAYPFFEQSSSWLGRCEATRWVVHLGSPQMSCIDPLDWPPEKCYWSGLDETPYGTRKDYHGTFRDIMWRFSICSTTLEGR